MSNQAVTIRFIIVDTMRALRKAMNGASIPD
jgi:hypothetical protein